MNKVQIHVKLELEDDRRYRVMVLLQRSDRPRYWVFHCNNCGQRGPEMMNTEIVATTDTMDMQNIDTAGIGYRCDGRINGQNCRIWYYFVLGD